MTVIFGLTTLDGAVLFAEQKRHHSDTKKDAGLAKKTVVLSRNAIAAKAGIGPDADQIWDLVRASIDGGDASAQEVADLIWKLAPDVLKEAREKGHPPETSLAFIVCGLTAGKPSIHGLLIDKNDRSDSHEPGQVMAIGTRLETQARATAIIHEKSEKVGTEVRTDICAWAKSLVEEEAQVNPHAVSYPVDMAEISSAGTMESIILPTLDDGRIIRTVAAI